MVKLYGVEHSMTITYGSLIPESKKLPVMPSDEFFADLESLPRGSRIGLECFNEKDWQDVKNHVKLNAVKAGFFGYPHYTDVTQTYWKTIIDFCKRAGHETVFLEDKETWKKYNKASIRLVKCQRGELYLEEGESRYHYHGKLCRRNEREYKADIARRKIHEMERDAKLLEAIKSGALRAAIVGRGHSDYWIFNQDRIKDEFGISFEDYSTDTPKRETVNRYSEFAESVFARKSVSHPRIVFERESLERAIRLIEQGRIILDRTPDYVGIWDICFPSKGYFEMFVEDHSDGIFSGKIEDRLGTAKFEGIITPTDLNFVKRYVVSEETAIQEPIEYKAKREGQECHGYFYLKEFGDAFFMTQSPKMDPVSLSLRWYELAVDKKKTK